MKPDQSPLYQEGNKKELKNFIHLYVGCECQFETGEGTIFQHKLLGIEVDYFTQEVYTKQIIYKSIKPILRHLDSMTEEELIEYGWDKTLDDCDYKGGSIEIMRKRLQRDEHFFTANDFIFLLSKSFDLFGLIDEGLAIDAATLKNNNP